MSGIEEVLMQQDAKDAQDSRKVVIDGQIYILRDGKVYDMLGGEVK